MPLCTNCGYQGQAKRITKGSFAIEIILWLLMILPGILYSVWRLASRYDGCPACGADNLIPLSSPVADKFLASLEVSPPKQIKRPKVITDQDDQPNVYVIK
jgi:hypothetical protein